MSTFHRPQEQQRGAVLIVALMFLIVLTLFGISAMTGTAMEERMSGNSRDYNAAFQAAEAALRDAESDLKTSGVAVGRTVTAFNFVAACTNGLCAPAAIGTQMYKTAPVSWTGATTTTYAQFTSAPPLTGLSSPPRYVMELLPGIKARASGSSTTVDYFYIRITATGWGANPNTQVQVQEIFLAPI